MILRVDYVVRADDKERARLIVSQIVLDALSGLTMAYPQTTPKRRRELESIRKLLAKQSLYALSPSYLGYAVTSMRQTDPVNSQ